MKRTGFRRLTYEEAQAKQDAARQRAAERRAAASVLPKTAVTKEKRPPTKAERVKTLKRSLWAVFSQYIRKSYADPMTGYLMTCDGQLKHWKETHCGHLFNNSERNQSLGGNELWYYEHNFAPQSATGNYFNAGDSAKKYMLWAVKKYGQEEVERMQQMKERPREFTEEELQAKLEHYKREFAKL